MRATIGVVALLLVGCGATPTTASPTTASNPSPSHPAAASQSIKAAIAVAAGKGYGDCQTSLYNTYSRLHALVCVNARRASSTDQFAFFFLDSSYIGTDAAAPSAHIVETWGTGDTVALLYVLYRPNDPMCCPTGGGAIVRYHWDGSRLQPLDPVPSSSIDAALSRR